MFICGNVCNNGTDEPEMAVVNKMALPAKVMSAISKNCKRSKKTKSVMLKKSKYDDYVKDCQQKGVKYTDKHFPPNYESLKFEIEGREITWKRVTEVVPNCVMVEDDFRPQDIQQGNIGDCYFLASIAALAEDDQRIEHIFFDNFQISPHGIYKLVVVDQGVPSEVVIDDYIPVFAATNRPVFCKATRSEIWVMLLEKVWAKIKGSYGQISAGCPHEVLETFSVAPCYYYQIEEHHDKEYLDWVWSEFIDSADELMPMVAGTRSEVSHNGLQPSHAYTVLDCEQVPSYGKVCRLMKLRNPWGKTQYTGQGSENDTNFWNGVPESFQQQMRPPVGVNDGIFTIPFEEFMKSFQSVDISNSIFGFSYEFERIKMYKGEPLFIKFDIKEEHEAFITVKRYYEQGTNKQIVTSKYGYCRLVIAHQLDQETFQFYESKLETDFPDITKFVMFKPGRYIMLVETEDPRLKDQFEATFSYYFDTLDLKENKHVEVQYGKKYPHFLDAVFLNHAIRLNDEKTKIGPKPQDWIKTMFLYDQGGFGYVMCNLQHDTNIKMSVTINKNLIRQSGFYLIGHHPQEQVIKAGENKIFVFSCAFEGEKADNIVFPPPGFKVSKIA